MRARFSKIAVFSGKIILGLEKIIELYIKKGCYNFTIIVAAYLCTYFNNDV